MHARTHLVHCEFVRGVLAAIATEFEHRKNTPFPNIVHMMVCNATLTVPDVLHSNEDGDQFIVIENVVCGIVNATYIVWMYCP